VDQLQEEVMQARMLPIARLFGKFPRLVRDLARAAGKQVNLVIEGEATELDRSIIEVIGDPLIHLIRNAVDHGIESPQERMAAGKPPTGTVWLSAAHEEGHIVISVKDNGRGITPERIRRAAVRQNILSEDEATQLDDEAAISLIFQPNLSTAERVTDVSGRGVGLDVVRTNVKQLSGSVVVESEVGHGTTFRITLPLTLAIVQAMLISVGDDSYAIPLTGIVESLYLSDVAVSSVKGKPVVRWRDRVLPLLHLREFFATPHLSSSPLNHDKQAIVIVSWGKLQVGLIVDDLIGKQEIVVKSLSPLLGNVPGISGCTILGDGRIALIIDISGLVSACLQAQRQEATT
jgi:two-component system chemotaxis sensor kinase CheA